MTMNDEPTSFEDVPLFDLPTGLGVGSQRERTGVVYDRGLTLTDRARARFARHIVKSPGCWFWTGAISHPDGYGRFTWQVKGKSRSISAHRFAALAAGLTIPDGFVVEHVCNEPLCVRVDPEHVQVTTQSKNILYAAELGRLSPVAGGCHSAMSRVERSRRVREAIKDGWDSDAYKQAISGFAEDQLSLF